jgi:hypothetical protein
MNLTLRTIARYENENPPKGPALKRFYELAEEVNEPEVAAIFKQHLWSWVPKQWAVKSKEIVADLEQMRNILEPLDTAASSGDVILKVREAIRISYGIERKLRDSDPFSSADS